MTPRHYILALAVLSSGCYLTVAPGDPADGSVSVTPTDGSACPLGAFPLSFARVEDLGVRDFPSETLSLTAEELRENRRTGSTSQIVVWPMGRAPGAMGQDLLYYGRFRARPGYLNFESLDVGVAEVPRGGFVASRRTGPLFTAPEPLFSSGTVTENGYVYVYACGIDGFLDAQCRLARAPLAGADNRRNYQFFDGGAWSGDIARAAEVVRGINGMSLRYNPHLGRFLAVYGGIVSDRVYVRTALRPEGPWASPIEVPSVLRVTPGLERWNFNARIITDETSDCSLTLAYAHPLSTEVVESRALRITLR